MKKVIQIGGNLRLNGISLFILTMYRNLYEDFQFIFINTAEGKDYYRDEVLALGGKVYDVIVGGKGLVRALKQAKEIKKIIKAEQPCAVHSHYYSNNGLYLKQAYLEGVPIRVSHCHQANPNSLSFGKRLAKYLSTKMIDKYATRKVACSEKASEFLYREGGEVVYNAISYDKFCLKNIDVYEKLGLEKEKKYFLFVGRFAEQKNPMFLLGLFNEIKELSDLVLLMVGHGPMLAEMQKYIKANSLSNVVLLPPDSDVVSLLSISQAFLLPSIYEGLPITLIEAQAVGVRCLVSEKITDEAQLGLIKYLPLNIGVWKDSIEDIIKKSAQHTPLKRDAFDDKNQAAIFKGIYNGISGDEWINWGKEYSIGSKTKYRSKYLSEACFEQSHRLGNARGTFYYALGYFEGNGVEKDTKKAKELVKPIVSVIESEAISKSDYMTILADMYSFGLGKDQDYEKAYKHYLQAAQQGNLEAMCDLGYMYQVGQGVEVDLEQSAYWYKKSADLGYVHSMRDIGQSFLNGIGVVKNSSEAVRYFGLASENNYSHGTGDLAFCYLNGIGIEKDISKAKELYKLALKQDDERTMRDLIALGVDIKALIEQDKLIILDNREITEISCNNTYADTLCISDRITRVDAKCLYSSTVKKIFVEKDNTAYSAKGGVLFDKTKSILVRFPPKSAENAYVAPNSVEVIGENAFQNCRNLRKIVLHSGIKKICDSAFDDCKNLEEIILVDGIVSIGSWAFHGCDRISKIFVPKSVKTIGKYAFGSCEALKEIIVEPENDNYCSIDGDLYDKQQNTLIQYAIAKQDEYFVVSKSVSVLAFRAFSDAYHLKEVNLCNVKEVGEKCFYYATSLKKAIICKGAKIGDKAFENTSSEFVAEVKE